MHDFTGIEGLPTIIAKYISTNLLGITKENAFEKMSLPLHQSMDWITFGLVHVLGPCNKVLRKPPSTMSGAAPACFPHKERCSV